MAAEQGSLKIGDTVLLQVGEPCGGYVYSELSSSAYNRVTVFPVDQDSQKGPSFPNVAFATFKVIAPNKYAVQQEYNLLLQDKLSSPVQSSSLDFLIASTKKQLKQEQQTNLLEQQKKRGTIVAYGDSIQLVHVGSKRHVSLSSEYTSKTESNNLLVQLSPDNSEACIFKVLPRYKVKSEGDQVRYEDQIKLESLKTQGQFLHCSQRPLSAVNVTLQPNHYELNLSALETAFTVIPHYSPSTATESALRAGSCVRLFHREGECYVVAEGSFVEHDLVEQVHCRQRRVDQSAHSMPSSSANTYWQIEKESDTRAGEVLYWEERCRIRHLPTRLYLTVRQNKDTEDGPKWRVGLKEKDNEENLDTLFSFYSLLKEGETVQLESYARIKHLLSDTWLHLDVQPYHRQSYDPRNIGLAGIQWDSAVLFQLTSCQAKGDYDAFTLQQINDDHLDKFNYMAGIVPILKSYNESIKLGTVTKKEGSQMVAVLKELHGWLEELNTREAKTKQKLMRNLRVLEQLRDILKHPAEATPLLILHKSVCRECYSVISQYLKGDSRKNENYLARFIEFFQTQVGMELNAEELLVEIVQDNLDIVSRMAKTQIDHMIAQLRAKRDPRFLYFLSSLCVCSGKPIPSTQNAIINKLVLPHGDDLFIKTLTRGKDVLCSLPSNSNPVNIINLRDPNKPDFHFLEAQLHLFARLCTGNNESAIEQLRFDRLGRRGFVSFDEAFNCAKSQMIHPTLKSRYVGLILVMFVAVGDNRSFLDHLCYSFVYSELSPRPYEESGGDDSEALTGVISEYFPVLKKWILEVIKANKVLVCDDQHIPHNEVLAQILDLLCHLVNYGYYDDQQDISDVLIPLFELLDGRTDSSGKNDAESFLKEGRFKDNEANRAAFAVKKTALEVAEKFLKFRSYVHLQVFIHDFKFLAEQGEADNPDSTDFPSMLHGLLRISGGGEVDVMSSNMHKAVTSRLDEIWTGSAPVTDMKAILIDLSRYENDDLVCHSLMLLTASHSQDETLFSHASHTQLLVADEALAISKDLQNILPTLRYLLSVDGDTESQWKIIDILGRLTNLCTRENDEEPHTSNQMMLYNYDVLSDILSFVLSKNFQQHAKEEHEPATPLQHRRISQQSMTQEVLRNCFVLLHALASKNELVQLRLFDRVGDLLKVRMAAFAVADVLTEIFTFGAKISMKVKEEDVDAIFETIIASRDPYTQAQLLISLQALAKIEELDLPMNSHQAQIVNNFCKHRQKIGEKFSGEEPMKIEERWRLLTECDDDNPDLQLLLSMTDLLATCAEGDNIFIESVCQTLLPCEELMEIMCADHIPVDRKRPFVRFLIWVYICTDGDRNVSEGASLSHNESLWKYLKRVAEKLHNFRRLLEVVPADNRGPYRRALVPSVRRRTYSLGHKPVNISSSIKNLPHYTREDGTVLPGVLEYFTEGIVPLLQNFFTILFDPTGLGALPNEGEIAVQVASALIRLVDVTMKFVTTNSLLQNFRSLVLTICTLPLIEQKLKIDMETYNKLNESIRNRHQSLSRSTRRHGDMYLRQKQINDEFHQFAKNYQRAYLGPNTARVQIGSPVGEEQKYCEEGEELPLGPNFQQLVNLYYKVEVPTVIPETERLLKQLEISISREEYLTEEEQQQQDMLDIRCLQVLRALIHNQIKMIDPEEEDSDPAHYRSLCEDLVNPIQVAIQEFDNAAKRVLPLLTHSKEEISDEALSLLKTLLFSGNETVQKGLEFVKYTREERLFIFLQNKLRHSATQYRETRLLQFQLADRQAAQQSLMDSASLSFPTVTSSLPNFEQSDSFCDVVVNIDGEDTNHEKIEFSGSKRSLERVSPARGLSPARQLSLDTGGVRFLQSPARGRSRSLQWAKDPEFLEMGSSFMVPRLSNTPAVTVTDGQADISPLMQADTSTKLVLEVIGLMCDGQHRSMQDYLRVQPDNFKNVNIVAEVAEFLQTYTNGICAENYDQIKEVLQALIEMCVGNPPNQHVILEKQVVDPINRILQLGRTGKLITKDDVSVLEIKGKAVELLEVMLEETSPESEAIKKSLQGSVNVHSLVQSMAYFRMMATEPLVKKEEKDDDAERGKFQCYHVLIGLADSDGKIQNLPVDAFCDQVEGVGKDWRKQSCSVEIHYKYDQEKHLLTKVHFFRDLGNTFREEVIKKIKWNIDRDSMENKHRALVDLFEPLKRDLSHQKKLRANPVFRVIKAFPQVRHYLLLLITLLLNLFVLSLFTVPEKLRPSDPTEAPRPNVLFSFDNVSTNNVSTPLLEKGWLQYPLYILGTVHLFLAVWMVVEYFLINFPHFRMPELFWQIINLIPRKKPFEFPQPSLLDVNIFGINTLWVLLFLTCSILSLAFLGYFYCICMLHIVFNNDILQRVLRSVTKNGIALLWVAFLGMVILFIYSVLSFAFLWDRYYMTDDAVLYCDTLFQCYVSIIRYGLIDNLGLDVPLDILSRKDDRPMFYLAAWRLFFDLSFFIIVTTIGLNIVFGIIVDTFSELRDERSSIEEDQKAKCFICDLESHEFDRKAKGFGNHIVKDHNMWDYVYYSFYLDSIDTSNHTALQKHVYNLALEKKPEFFPREEACCFEAEDDPVGQKLEFMHEEMARLLQRFRDKDASKSVNAKKAERKIWEEKVLKPQQSFRDD